MDDHINANYNYESFRSRFVRQSNSNKNGNSRYVKILMDSEASALIIHDSFVRTNKLNTRKTSAKKWSTMAGSFLTLCEADVKNKLPE